jgi:hypothetical protein
VKECASSKDVMTVSCKKNALVINNALATRPVTAYSIYRKKRKEKKRTGRGGEPPPAQRSRAILALKFIAWQQVAGDGSKLIQLCLSLIHI